MKIFLLIFWAIQLVLSTPVVEDLRIKLPDGKVQGKIFYTPNHKIYYGFQGLPYATPPLGTLRFEDPQLPKPWNGTRDATKERPVCISDNHWTSLVTESEDCLYLNVYTPYLKPTEKLPVMLWIHGGAFTYGSSNKELYNPDFLIEEDVVFVSINYRLGPFGFLSTGDSAIRGNAGIKDQNLALKWAKKNIALFGGDPEKITIFGQSAGGFSAAHHILNKKSAGLFRAAILESGSALNDWYQEDPKSNAFKLADALFGSQYKYDTVQLKKFFKTLTAEQIFNATVSIQVQFWPVMEVEGDDSFISQPPYQLVKSGNFNKVPIMTGITSEESIKYLIDLEYTKKTALSMDSTPILVIPFDLKQNDSDTDVVIEEIKKIFLKNGETFSSNLKAVTDHYSDISFNNGVIKMAELSSQYVPVYLYQYSYYGRSMYKAFIEAADKCSHSAELPFLFNKADYSSTNLEDIRIQNISVKLWTNFVKYLNPTPEPSAIVDITWPTISPTNLQYLNINTTLEVLPSIKPDRYSTWTNIYETYGSKPFITF